MGALENKLSLVVCLSLIYDMEKIDRMMIYRILSQCYVENIDWTVIYILNSAIRCQDSLKIQIIKTKIKQRFLVNFISKTTKK